MVSLGGLFLKKHLCESPGHQSVQVECSEVVEGKFIWWLLPSLGHLCRPVVGLPSLGGVLAGTGMSMAAKCRTIFGATTAPGL